MKSEDVRDRSMGQSANLGWAL